MGQRLGAARPAFTNDHPPPQTWSPRAPWTRRIGLSYSHLTKSIMYNPVIIRLLSRNSYALITHHSHHNHSHSEYTASSSHSIAPPPAHRAKAVCPKAAEPATAPIIISGPTTPLSKVLTGWNTTDNFCSHSHSIAPPPAHRAKAVCPKAAEPATIGSRPPGRRRSSFMALRHPYRWS